MHLVIAKVNETLYDAEAHSVTLPAAAGEMTVLGEHMPLITTLKAGVVRVHIAAGDEAKVFKIEGGVVEVRRDGATIVL